MELSSVQLIPGNAEITGDKGMYPRASGGLGGPQTPTLFHRINTYSTFCSILWTVLGISAMIRELHTFILPLRKNMITHSFRIKFFYFLLFINDH